MFNLAIALIWAITVMYVWQMYEEFLDKLNWIQKIELIIIVLIFAPIIILSMIGLELIDLIFCQNVLEEYIKEEKELKIAIVQFKEIDKLADSRFPGAAARIRVDWYYFDENEDREFAIKDLKEHYDLVIEVIEL